MVLLHGLGASLEWWEEAAEDLAVHYRVVVPDLPGHGLSDEPKDEYSLPAARETLGGLLDSLGIRRALIAGNSMGGLVALSFALHHPERVGSLVLVANAGFGRPLGPALPLATLPGVGETALRFARYEWIARIAFGRILYDSRRLPAGWLSRVVRLCRRATYPKAFLACLRHGVDTGGLKRHILTDIARNVGRLTAPVLILWGRDDTVIPVAHAEWGGRLISHAKLVVLAGCGHAPQLELPHETAAVIHSFTTHSHASRSAPS
jgi:pimeloyl-ACP methyl ester carboxylesterase